MSHKATGWLSDVTDVTPSEFRILFILCDCHNPSKGCFPSQGYLQTKSGMSNGSINNQLNSLEKKGLISRERRIDPKTRQRKSTKYTLGFEIEKPTPNIGEGAISNPDPKPSPNNGQSHLQILETNLVIEPVREPVSNPLPPSDVVVDLDAEFEIWWKHYPKKVEKHEAKPEFIKARKKVSFEVLATSLKAYVVSTRNTEMRYIIHGSRWLKRERWNDDQTHAANRSQTSEDDLRSLGAGTAADDMGSLFSEPLSIEGMKQ